MDDVEVVEPGDVPLMPSPPTLEEIRLMDCLSTAQRALSRCRPFILRQLDDARSLGRATEDLTAALGATDGALELA